MIKNYMDGYTVEITQGQVIVTDPNNATIVVDEFGNFITEIDGHAKVDLLLRAYQEWEHYFKKGK